MDKKYLLTGIDPETWRRAKSILASRGQTMKAFLIESLKKLVKEDKN
jgi:hypothetical protein